MLSREWPDCIHAAGDDHRLVAKAELMVPVTPAQYLGCVGLPIATLPWDTYRCGGVWAASCRRWWRLLWSEVVTTPAGSHYQAGPNIRP